jgi:hypothetical protein
MIRLDNDTINMFNGDLNEENSICFYGDKDLTWNVIYKQNFAFYKTFDFYKIIKPVNNALVNDIYIFNFLSDALIFYKSKDESFFNYCLIVIVDQQSTKEVAQLLSDILNNLKPRPPKLHFFHRKEKADLYLFYLEMLKIEIHHSIEYISNKLCLSIKYKSLDLVLSFEELNRLQFFLGINTEKFKVNNNVLSLIDTKKIIIW